MQHILEALGDTDSIEAAAERLQEGFSAPKLAAKQQTKVKNASTVGFFDLLYEKEVDARVRMREEESIFSAL